jgi:hypothetical protein
MLTLRVLDANAQDAGQIHVNPHEFSTGSRGFRGNQKVKVNGRRYQVNVQLVEIGSKPKAE